MLRWDYPGPMSLFSKKKRAAKPKPRLVSVNYRDLGPNPHMNPEHGYVYKWGLAGPPAVGLWVWVNGDGEQTTAVVCNTNASLPKGFRLGEIKTVSRLVSGRDLKRAGA